MKKYEVEESFIRDAHKVACAEWKSKLESNFPDVFKQEFNVGDWVIAHNGYVGKVTDIKNSVVYWDDATSNPYGDSYIESVRIATESEILSHLTKEAGKRGFKEGVKVKCLLIGEQNLSGKIEYNASIRDEDRLWFGTTCIYNKGKWATIIEQPKDKIAELIEKYSTQIVEIKHQIELLDQQSERIKEVLNGSR